MTICEYDHELSVWPKATPYNESHMAWGQLHYYRIVPPITPPPFCLHLPTQRDVHLAYNNMKPFFRDSSMIFINCLRQYNEIHVITKPCSSTCQVCVNAVRGGVVLYSIWDFIETPHIRTLFGEGTNLKGKGDNRELNKGIVYPNKL